MDGEGFKLSQHQFVTSFVSRFVPSRYLPVHRSTSPLHEPPGVVKSFPWILSTLCQYFQQASGLLRPSGFLTRFSPARSPAHNSSSSPLETPVCTRLRRKQAAVVYIPVGRWGGLQFFNETSGSSIGPLVSGGSLCECRMDGGNLPP